MKLKALVTAIMLSASAPLLASDNLANVVASGDRSHALDMVQAGAEVDAVRSDGTTALLYAAHQGDAELAGALLEAGADPDVTNDYGAFPLSEAAISDSPEVVRLLLEHGARVDQSNPEGETALMVAARQGSMEIARTLLEHGADINAREQWGGQTPLMWASAQQQTDMMRLLIENGADIDAKGKARYWDRRITSEPRPKDMNKGGFSPLHYAARQGCTQCVEILAGAGADLDTIDPDRVTPLNLALINQHFDTAAALIEAGADVDKWDLFGRTPLYNAADLNTLPAGGRNDIPSDDARTGLDIARMLLERGADPNIQLKLRPPYRNVPFDRGADSVLSTGATPLMRAARAADNPLVELLLQHGALPDLPNAEGVTPLMVVAGIQYPDNPTRGAFKTEEESVETIRLLLDAGADINALTGDPTVRPKESDRNPLKGMGVDPRDQQEGGAYASNQTALHGAAIQGWNVIAQYLIDNGIRQQVVDDNGRTPIDLAMGRYPPAFLEAPPEPMPDTVILLQNNCMEAEDCELEEVIDFSDPSATAGTSGTSGASGEGAE